MRDIFYDIRVSDKIRTNYPLIIPLQSAKQQLVLRLTFRAFSHSNTKVKLMMNVLRWTMIYHGVRPWLMPLDSMLAPVGEYVVQGVQG